MQEYLLQSGTDLAFLDTLTKRMQLRVVGGRQRRCTSKPAGDLVGGRPRRSTLGRT